MALFPSSETADAQQQQRQVILLVADRLSFSDLIDSSLPHLHEAEEDGAVGLMNITTGGGISDGNAYATIGAGAKAVAGALPGLTLDRNEFVSQTPVGAGSGSTLYRRLNGRSTPSGDVLVAGVGEATQQNASLPPKAVVGLLGETIHRYGGTTAVIGNADSGPDQLQRYGPWIGMDEAGAVDRGTVSASVLQAQPTAAFGVEADTAAIHRQLSAILPHATLTVIDPGDGIRLDRAATAMSPQAYAQQKQHFLASLDATVGQLLPLLGPNRMLIILSPVVSTQAWQEGERLAPVIAVGGNIPPGTLWTSPTTRRTGIVQNVDIAPTILYFLGMSQPAQMSGLPATAVEVTYPLQTLHAVFDKTVTTYQTRGGVLATYEWILIIAFGIGTVLLLLGQRGLLRLLRPLWTALAVVPLAMLTLTLSEPQPAWSDALLLVGETAGWTVLTFAVRDPVRRLLAILGTVALGVAAAVCAGDWPMYYAYLSFDPIVGVRNYGISNEYMGVLIGSALLAAGAGVSLGGARRWVQMAALGSLLGVLLLLAWPTLGTNAGGAITAAFGTALFFSLYLLKERRWRAWAWTFAGAFGGVALLVGISVLLPGVASHIGRAVGLLFRGDFSDIGNIIARKWAANMNVLGYSSWRWVALITLLLGAVALWRGRLDHRRPLPRPWQSAIWATGAAGVVAFLINDTGVTAAGAMWIYLAIAILWTAGKEK